MNPNAKSERERADALFGDVEKCIEERDRLAKIVHSPPESEVPLEAEEKLVSLNMRALPTLHKACKDLRNASKDIRARIKLEKAMSMINGAVSGIGEEKEVDISDGAKLQLEVQLASSKSNGRRRKIGRALRQLEQNRKLVDAAITRANTPEESSSHANHKAKTKSDKGKKILRKLGSDIKNFLPIE